MSETKNLTGKDILGNDEKQMLVCLRVNRIEPVYGSVRAVCDECKAAIWVSVSGQKALQSGRKLIPFCMECASAQIENSDEEVKGEIVPGAIEEMLRHFSNSRNN